MCCKCNFSSTFLPKSGYFMDMAWLFCNSIHENVPDFAHRSTTMPNSFSWLCVLTVLIVALLQLSIEIKNKLHWNFANTTKCRFDSEKNVFICWLSKSKLIPQSAGSSVGAWGIVLEPPCPARFDALVGSGLLTPTTRPDSNNQLVLKPRRHSFESSVLELGIIIHMQGRASTPGLRNTGWGTHDFRDLRV